MKKKIEIHIVYVILYLLAFLLVCGMLFYKSCLDQNQEKKEVQIVPKEQLEEPSTKEIISRPKDIKQETNLSESSVKEENTKIAELDTVMKKEVESSVHPERNHIQIPSTKSVFNLSHSETGIIPEGKKYYENSQGILESQIIQNEKGISEWLIAKNKQGEVIDRLEISWVDTDRNVLKHATISQNKIHIYEIKSSNKNQKEEIRTEYIIRPDFRFAKGKSYSKLM